MIGNSPAGLRGCGNVAPDETWKPSTPASSSHLQTWIESSIVVPLALPGEQIVVVVDGGDLELHVEVVADLGADRAHDLEREARPVLERAAVLVVAVVDRRREELRDQVAVAAVDLDPVGAGLARAARGLREALDDLLDLGLRHGDALEAVDRLRLARRAPALLVDDAADVALPARERELREVLAVVLVHLVDQLAPERDRLVAVDVRVVRHDDPARVDGCVGRDDRADPAARELEVPVDVDARAGSVVVVEAAGEARAQHAVLDRQVLELERREDDAVAHATASVTRVGGV